MENCRYRRYQYGWNMYAIDVNAKRKSVLPCKLRGSCYVKCECDPTSLMMIIILSLLWRCTTPRHIIILTVNWAMFRFDRSLSVCGGCGCWTSRVAAATAAVFRRTGRYYSYNSVHGHHAVYIRSKVGAPARRRRWRGRVAYGGRGPVVRAYRRPQPPPPESPEPTRGGTQISFIIIIITIL